MSGFEERLTLVPQVPPGLPSAAPGAIRFCLEGVPERERPAVFREYFGREVTGYDIEILPDVSFDVTQTHRMLTDPRRAGEKISAIALDAAFGDVSYFNRAFRRSYGETPSGVRVHAVGRS